MEKDKIVAREAFNKLSTPKKIAHLWEYYKWHTIATLLVLSAAISIIHANVTRIHPDLTAMFLVTPQNFVSNEVVDSLEEHFARYATDANGDERVVITIMPLIFNPHEIIDEMGMALIQRLDAQIAAGDVKLFIVDDVFLEWLEIRYGDDFLEQPAPIINPPSYIEDSSLFVSAREIFPRDLTGRHADRRKFEHENARIIYRLLTE